MCLEVGYLAAIKDDRRKGMRCDEEIGGVPCAVDVGVMWMCYAAVRIEC